MKTPKMTNGNAEASDVEKLAEARRLLSEVADSTDKRSDSATDQWEKFDLWYVSYKLRKDVNSYLEHYAEKLSRLPQAATEPDQMPEASKS